MQIKFKLDKGAFKPEKAHSADAGYDIRTPHEFTVRPHTMVMVHTGLHISIPEGYYGRLESKSGLCAKDEITTEAGIIDSGYTGEICVILRAGGSIKNFKAGDKISQLIIEKIQDTELVEAETLEDTLRGSGGFGSTGR